MKKLLDNFKQIKLQYTINKDPDKFPQPEIGSFRGEYITNKNIFKVKKELWNYLNQGVPSPNYTHNFDAVDAYNDICDHINLLLKYFK